MGQHGPEWWVNITGIVRPEFISSALVQFCESENIKIKHTQPGKPVQNAYIERFNRTFREDILDAYIFENLNDLKELAEHWMEDYNENHPHQSLNGKSPKQYLAINCGKTPTQNLPAVLPQLTA